MRALPRNLDDDRDPYLRDAPETSRSFLADTLDLLGRRIGGALVLAGALVGIGLYTGGGDGDEAPKYQAFAADGEVFRVNTENGTIIACNATRCMRILARGQELAEDEGSTLFTRAPGGQQVPQQPQLPAPSPQQAPAAPAPQPAPAAQPPAR